jgi:hypothetical protein
MYVAGKPDAKSFAINLLLGGEFYRLNSNSLSAIY